MARKPVAPIRETQVEGSGTAPEARTILPPPLDCTVPVLPTETIVAVAEGAVE